MPDVVTGEVLARSIVAALPRCYARLNVRPEPLALVVLLAARRCLSIDEIREALGVGQSTASKYVDRAAAIGLVERQRGAHEPPVEHRKVRSDGIDGRQSLVTLTALGRRYAARARGPG